MALKAFLDPITDDQSDHARRGEARRSLLLETNGIMANGGDANVTVHNISAAGMLLETDVQLNEGDGFEIDLPEVGRTEAVIVWGSGRLFGCAFKETVAEGALAATQLHAAIANPRGEPVERAAPSEGRHPEPLGIKLGRLRRERGLTLAQVADALGVSKPTVWAWEKSKARPVRDRLPQIAEVLGVSGDELGQAASGTGGAALIEECRVRIAAAHRVQPANIRIMIEI